MVSGLGILSNSGQAVFSLLFFWWLWSSTGISLVHFVLLCFVYFTCIFLVWIYTSTTLRLHRRSLSDLHLSVAHMQSKKKAVLQGALSIRTFQKKSLRQHSGANLRLHHNHLLQKCWPVVLFKLSLVSKQSHCTVTMILILLVNIVFSNKLLGQGIGVLILLLTSLSYFNILRLPYSGAFRSW